MNKDWIRQLPADEQAAAEKLTAAAQAMKLSQSFQWHLETQLMDAYSSQKRNEQNLFMKFLVPAGWAIAVMIVIILLWITRLVLPTIQPAAAPTTTRVISFETSVRAGNICAGPLTLAHGFDVFLTNADKTGFVTLEAGKAIAEIRSFAWSMDGKQLAILGNSQGRGNIYLTNLNGTSLQPVLANSELDYLMDAAWSRDGKQFVMWSLQNNKVLYLMSADGTNVEERQMDVQIIGAPQFTPDGKSVVFYGGDTQAMGLFQLNLATSEIALINPFVEDPSGFAFSPDGSLLAYLEYDRDKGEARLFTANRMTGERTTLGKFPIPKQPGSSLPDGANLDWSADGELLVFDLGFTSSNRAIYLAHADGSGLAKLADAGYAPTISTDGKCLAYINDKKLFLLDLIKATPAAPLFLANLPNGRAIADVRLDKLQWKP